MELARQTGTWHDVWESPSWIQLQTNANAFLAETTDLDGMMMTCSECFGEPFDALCDQIINTMATTKHGGNSNSKKSSRALLQPFCEGQLRPSFRLMTYSSFRENVDPKMTLHQLLRHVQWQILLRLALWERMGNKAFIAAWMHQVLGDMPPKRRRRAKKQGHGTEQAWKLCCEDVTSLVSLGLMKGLQESEKGSTNNVEAFLNSCGLEFNEHKRSWKSRLVKDVWTFFDIVQDAKPVKKTAPTKGPQPSAVLPPLHAPEEESIKTKTTTSSTATNKENAQSFFGKRVKLTAPAAKKTNALLGKSARSRFVGSHFNTNLTNMSALFRTVPSQLQASRKPNKPVVAHKRPATSLAKAANKDDSPPCKIRVAVQVSETPAPQRKRSRVVWETPDNYRLPRVLRL